MTIWNAIILGLVQGIAEFLPISSSGHLAILQNLFGMTTTENGHMFFDVLLHFGTLISICIVYWEDIVSMFRELAAYSHRGRADDGRPIIRRQGSS
jgi:undecaprenyl-diphosphatase